jgi:hypothetical protein
MNSVRLTFFFCVVALYADVPARAADTGDAHPYLTERFYFDVGIYFPDRTLRISVDDQNGTRNRAIDFNDEFRIKRSDETAAFNFGWRMSKHWKLAAQYFRTSDDVTATLDEEIEWGDGVVPVGADINAGQEFALTRVLIGYEFNNSGKQAFGIGGGLHILDISAYIEGDITVDGTTEFGRRSVHATALLPNIGTWYRYSLTEKWVVTARLDWLSVEFGEYDGRLLNGSAGINYQMFDNFGIGANYNYFEVNVGVNKNDWVGKAFTRYDGLFVYLSAYW